MFWNPIVKACFLYRTHGISGFLPDRAFLKKICHYSKTRKMDIDNPVTFNEKIQWLKLYDRRPEHVCLADKFEVRKFVAKTVGEEILIPCYGVWDKFEQIPFADLPDQFVLKCTHDCGSVVICKDKNTLDMDKTRRRIKNALSVNHYWHYREWLYKNLRPRVVAEQLISDGSGSDLMDYKIFCFGGTPKIVKVDYDRFSDHQMSCYTPGWEYIDSVYQKQGKEIPKPGCLGRMLELAEKLSAGIPQVRVDLYVVGDKIYFGEMTFYNAAGFSKLTPEYDKQMGDWWVLPPKRR